MNSKEVETLVCSVCESSFKLIYDLTKTSGYAKFCCFCGEVIEDGDGINNQEKDSDTEEA